MARFSRIPTIIPRGTIAQRPAAGKFPGHPFYVTDLDGGFLSIWDGAIWVNMAIFKQIARQEMAASVLGLGAVGDLGMAITFDVPAGRTVEVELGLPWNTASAVNTHVQAVICDNANTIKRSGRSSGAAAANGSAGQARAVELLSVAGTYTRKARAAPAGAAGTVSVLQDALHIAFLKATVVA